MKRVFVCRLLTTVAVASSLVAFSRPARASDSAAAEALFNEARALAQRGDYEHACPKLEESQRLDAGMGTLFNLGDCYEHVGKTASAWAAFREVAASASAAGQQAREADARARAAALEPKLVTLVIEVSPSSANLLNLAVQRDAVAVGRAQWGSAIPIDPGKHVIVASADGKQPWQTEVTILESAKSTKVLVPALQNAAVTPSKAAERQAPTNVGSTQRTVGLVVGGAGIVGLGLGAIFGLRSISRHDDEQGHCDADSVCDPTGVTIRNEARDAGNISTAAFIAGGVLFAGGMTLFLTAPRASSPRASVGIGPGSVMLKGAF